MPSNLPADASEGVKTIVVIPTYNEAENLPSLIAELLALGVPGLTALVVDDNSPDGTGQVAETLAQRFPGFVHVRHRAGKEGLGKAYLDGFARRFGTGRRSYHPDGCRLLASAERYSDDARRAR